MPDSKQHYVETVSDWLVLKVWRSESRPFQFFSSLRGEIFERARDCWSLWWETAGLPYSQFLQCDFSRCMLICPHTSSFNISSTASFYISPWDSHTQSPLQDFALPAASVWLHNCSVGLLSHDARLATNPSPLLTSWPACFSPLSNQAVCAHRTAVKISTSTFQEHCGGKTSPLVCIMIIHYFVLDILDYFLDLCGFLAKDVGVICVPWVWVALEVCNIFWLWKY